ncbi:NAD(P)-dependent oxidoreductase [Nonomuraea roseoviolacea]|uniref:NADH-flavin reductase n=1 Tax=Nonomuraea roseoviolacea subsp. carminata TaxID=160689 RepID=A0ABT1K1P0_9ACTN|nr:SDR family oxidoreductase [Nonomuraea roseoviolacea]MCP2347909.1 putative NADH-flavin reductase [Nonomuraea roseoviolacea subsp. carminata]
MRITVFGATGRTGWRVVGQALHAGHEVTAVVRDPAALERHNLGGPRLTVVRADVMDPAAIRPAVAGHDAVVSAIGPRGSGPTTVCADSIASIMEAMAAEEVRRLVAVSASGFVREGDGPLTRLVAKPILSRVLRHAFADMRRMEDLVRASRLDWTIVRPPQLTEGPRTGSYRSAIDRNVRGGVRVSRADLADCVLRCLDERGPLHAALAIGN